MNVDFCKSAVSSGLVSTLCLVLAIPLVGMGVLWTVSPLIAGIFGTGVLAIYLKAIRIVMKTLTELDLSNM